MFIQNALPSVPPSATLDVGSRTVPEHATSVINNPGQPSDLNDTFRKLLVAQLRNQNPLEPMESSQMVSQLAMLTNVGELQAMRLGFEQLGTRLDNILGVGSSKFIGHQVAVNTAPFAVRGSSESLSLIFRAPNQSQLTSRLFNDTGQIIAEVKHLLSTDHKAVPVNKLFGPLGAGSYYLESMTETGQPVTAFLLSKVQGIRLSGDGQEPLLLLDGTVPAALSAVHEIYGEGSVCQ